MKTKYIIIILSFFSAFSCIDDKSNIGLKEISTIEYVDGGLEPIYRVDKPDMLILGAPRVKQSYIENDESSNQLSEFYDKLFDHGALWKLENGRVICTAMPYSDEKIVLDEFERLKHKYEYPDNVILNFLDEKYKFRKNGDIMVVISFDEI